MAVHPMTFPSLPLATFGLFHFLRQQQLLPKSRKSPFSPSPPLGICLESFVFLGARKEGDVWRSKSGMQVIGIWGQGIRQGEVGFLFLEYKSAAPLTPPPPPAGEWALAWEVGQLGFSGRWAQGTSVHPPPTGSLGALLTAAVKHQGARTQNHWRTRNRVLRDKEELTNLGLERRLNA